MRGKCPLILTSSENTHPGVTTFCESPSWPFIHFTENGLGCKEQRRCGFQSLHWVSGCTHLSSITTAPSQPPGCVSEVLNSIQEGRILAAAASDCLKLQIGAAYLHTSSQSVIMFLGPGHSRTRCRIMRPNWLCAMWPGLASTLLCPPHRSSDALCIHISDSSGYP